MRLVKNMGTGDIPYLPSYVKKGIPPPEKWGGLELAKTIGLKGYTVETMVEDSKKIIGFEGGDTATTCQT